MKVIQTTASPSILEGHISVGAWRLPRRAVFPVFLLLLALAGVFSPLFDLNTIHGVPSAKLYVQHLYFDGIADAGGFYAATFCKHWYHRIPIAIGFALICTFCLVTLVG